MKQGYFIPGENTFYYLFFQHQIPANELSTLKNRLLAKGNLAMDGGKEVKYTLMSLEDAKKSNITIKAVCYTPKDVAFLKENASENIEW